MSSRLTMASEHVQAVLCDGLPPTLEKCSNPPNHSRETVWSCLSSATTPLGQVLWNTTHVCRCRPLSLRPVSPSFPILPKSQSSATQMPQKGLLRSSGLTFMLTLVRVQAVTAAFEYVTCSPAPFHNLQIVLDTNLFPCLLQCFCLEVCK